MCVFILWLFVLGLCLGSFINALVWRIHETEGQKRLSSKKKKELSILRGRSMCIYCHHLLKWYDLIPVISWLSLRGKCRYCHKPIHWQYPLVELSTALLFVGSYIFWPVSISGAEWISFITWLVCLVGLVALFVYDVKYMLLPNKIVFPLLYIASIGVIVEAIARKDTSVIVEAAMGTIVGGGLFYVLFQVSGGKWIGGGDVKLGFLLGIIVGSPALSFLMIFLASLVGTIYVLPLMASKKLNVKAQIPYGPFLIVGATIAVLFGQQILQWYTNGFY